MSAKSKIQWTDRTWNPVRGCSLVSPGCTNCYAMRQAKRVDAMWEAQGFAARYGGLWRETEHGPVWTGDIRVVPAALEEPLRWRQPSRVFVNSMSDLFHEGVPDEFIDKVWRVMRRAHKERGHTFQILTKRPANMLRALGPRGIGWYANEGPVPCPEPGIWLGVSVENQATADERIPLLLQTPAAVRFLSVEPLLEAVDISDALRRRSFDSHGERTLPRLHWVIVGGESGPRSRPCHLDWMRSIVRQCQAPSVATFVKQWGAVPVMDEGEWRRTQPARLLSAAKRDRYPGAVTLHLNDPKGGDPLEWPEDVRTREWPRQA